MEVNHAITKTKYTTDKKVLLSTLWIFAMLNYLYCDVVTLMDSNLLGQYLKGIINGMSLTQGFLLGAAILMKIPIAMVLLSRVLKYKANRWANIYLLRPFLQCIRRLHRLGSLYAFLMVMCNCYAQLCFFQDFV